MHYYPHNISDFNNATRHLTRVERSVYRDAIDLYYDTELALPLDIEKLSRKLLCNSEHERDALILILSEFFIKKETGYEHDRCNIEIEKYRANTSAKARAGIASAAKRKQNATRVEHTNNECATNHKPLTINQKPETKEKPSSSPKGSRYPLDSVLNSKWGNAALELRSDFDNDDVRIEHDAFKDYWAAKPGKDGVKLDWLATWRNWCRNSKRIGKNTNG